MGELKEDIDSSLNGISKFLQDQMEHSSTRQAPSKKVRDQEYLQHTDDVHQAKLSTSTGKQPPIDKDVGAGIISVES